MKFVIWKNLCKGLLVRGGIRVEKELEGFILEGFVRAEICSMVSGFLYVSWCDI
jgi:hypothetical protein